jgi:hypothetical protein
MAKIGWGDIIKTCKDISKVCPSWKCLQSTTLLSPLYTDAIGIHDEGWWRFAEVGTKLFENRHCQT